MVEVKETELYQELELYIGDQNIGKAEISIKENTLSLLTIYPPYQNKGYGTEVVKMLTEKYNLDNLWVNSDNERAIHTYEKNGYRVVKPTMYLMENK